MIIVNYNVQHFIDQCLNSVVEAIKNVNTEVIIVDNASVDGSIEMIKEKYPQFTLIENKDNGGFSKGNNQAIKIAQGEYVILLNPDTVVGEDTFKKVTDFMDKNEDTGGLGVRMIDGKGNFLPESKRGLPSPMVAFYKIFGLSKIFPKSKRFAQYHAGHVSEFESSEIDILSGAFMMMRSEALEKVGLLDEDFFMYGEDIDLSYRIQKGGYKNHYFAETEIIHYKGESTKKSSVNYVFVFYRAMVIFAKKHFSGKNAWLYSFLINLGIYLRAFLAISSRIIKSLFIPIIDLAYIVIGLFALTNYWRISHIEFPQDLIKYSIPAYGIIWVISVFFNGGYDRPLKVFKFLKGTFLGTIFILLIYAVLPKSLQFSRLFIFIGTAWTVLYYLISRLFLRFTLGKRYRLTGENKLSFMIVGDETEFDRISGILKQSNNKVSSIVHSSTIPTQTPNVDEIIFCKKNCTNKDIITFMSSNLKEEYDYKIAPESGDYLIGSNSIDTAGDLYVLDINMLVNKENKRKKRLFDLVFSFGLLITTPLLIFTFKNKNQFFKNVLNILTGKKSFIGFSELAVITDVRLPKIKPGVLSPCDAIENCDSSLRSKLNLLYARDYSMRKDFSILWKSWRHLDR